MIHPNKKRLRRSGSLWKRRKQTSNVILFHRSRLQATERRCMMEKVRFPLTELRYWDLTTAEPSELERQLALTNKGADIVYCSYDFIDEQNNLIKKPFVVPQQTNFNKMLASSVISCSTSFIKTELMQAHPFNPDFYHEDYVLWMELLRVCPTAFGDQKVLMHYRQVTGSRSNKKGNAAKERWNTYRKALKLNVVTSAWAFVRYALNGVMKYYL